MAYASTLGEGETFTTLELKINFLKPVWQAKLQAIGRVVKHGLDAHHVGVVERVDDGGGLVQVMCIWRLLLRQHSARGALNGHLRKPCGGYDGPRLW
jgi:hypothetical protein